MAKRRIGILTAGGDCPGLNAVIRGVGKASFERFGGDVRFIGIADGFSGLINGEYREMERGDFSGILTLGGTILGSSRTPYKSMRSIGSDNIDKVKAMKDNYAKMRLDALITLGGNGTHKSADMLCKEGLNVIGLPKTIDNDIWGTDVTFGFHTAVDTATAVIDRLHTTAASHGRVIVVELMGNKAGWLTLYAGMAGGADVIIIPEIPYFDEAVAEAVLHRTETGADFSIVCVAEGAGSKRSAQSGKTEAQRIADEINRRCRMETRVTVPGLILRGGSPSAYDRLLSTQLGVYAAKLLETETYGVSAAFIDGAVTHNPLSVAASKTKLVPSGHQLTAAARDIGISFGD